VKAYTKYHNKGLEILGVSLDTRKEAWIKAITDDKLSWNQVSDLQGWGNEVAVLYEIQSVPANLLIDPTGKVIAKDLRGEELEKKLAEILK
jgi:alkyl hydroperoxide reductase subunit AhpC